MKRLVQYAVLVALTLITIFSRAQVDSTQLNGTVNDQSGAPIREARVRVVLEDSQVTRTTATGEHGNYTIPALPIGLYTISFEKTGFATTRIEHVQQTAGNVRTLDITLHVQSVSETVEVIDTVADLDKTTATFGGTVSGEQVRNIPLNGRNWATLETLAPGAIDSGSGLQSSIRFAGNGIDDNNYRLDGVDASGVMKQALKSALRLQISSDAIAEFKVDSAVYTAENGGSAGGQVSVVSKSGSNQFHGKVFDFLRNDIFDARSPLNPTTSKKPAFHLNQYGTDLGGPIIRDRTFFFASYEGFRQVLGGVPQVGLVPSALFRQKVASLSAPLQAIITAYPTGQSPSGDKEGYADNYTSYAASPVKEDSGLGRIDHHINEKNSIYVRYNTDQGSSTSPLNAVGQSIEVDASVHNAVIDYLHVFTPRLINEAKFGLNRNTYHQNQVTGLPINFSFGGGFTSLGETIYKQQVSTTFSYLDTVIWTLNRHTLKFGVDVRRVQFNEANTADGTASWTSLDNFLSNTLNSFQATAPLPDRGLRKTQIAAYAQDEWKFSSNVTVNAGVRYGFFQPFSLAHGLSNPFDIQVCGGYCRPGSPFSYSNYLNFDPRLAITWSPSGSQGNMVFRVGYGMYHGESELADQDSPAVNDEPSITFQSSATQAYAYPIDPSLIPTTGLAVTPRSMSLHHPDSYVQNWTASMQNQWPGKVVSTVSYLGAKGTHLFRRTYGNVFDPALGKNPLAPAFPSQVDTKTQEGASSFNALQVNVKREVHNGMFLAGNYMWSHAINDGSVGAGESNSAQNVVCFQCERGSSDFDVRNSGNISLLYELPFGRGRRFLNQNRLADVLIGGWEFTDLLNYRSGLPVNIVVSRSNAALPDHNNVNQRPDLVPGQPLYFANRSIKQWFNPSAFAVPVNGTWGNAPRDYGRGPILWQDDLALDKNFNLVERCVLNFRAEAFNIFNRAQYGNPNATFGAGNFGTITTTANATGLIGTGTPRVMQFAASISF
ncbi:carboxypeptidase family protein [Edaphobacter modestus]|uniref:Carboxypeptidase family protein n=1 Tax=Edaphobacter modestus TaxID=388466 RepID=A0A4Q7Z044_9BACT|nr:carboxypeptidase family protein [Edaphobacter modestus]